MLEVIALRKSYRVKRAIGLVRQDIVPPSPGAALASPPLRFIGLLFGCAVAFGAFAGWRVQWQAD